MVDRDRPARVRARDRRRDHHRPAEVSLAPTPARATVGALSDEAWADAHDHLIGFLREMLRIPSINPPDPPGPELGPPSGSRRSCARSAWRPRSSSRSPAAARWSPASAATAPAATRCSSCPTSTSSPPRPRAGRRPVRRRRRRRLCLRAWRGRHEGDGRALGGGHAAARRAGPRRRPRPRHRPDPGPPPRHPVRLDRGRGERRLGGSRLDRRQPAGAAAAAAAFSEAGGVSADAGGRRFYPIQVAEKGHEVYRIHVKGTQGHGSLPRDDNAAVLAAEVVRRLATPGEPRITPVVRRLLDEVSARPGRGPATAPGRGDGRRSAPGRGSRSARCATRSTRGSCARSSATRSARTSSTPG